MGGGEYALYNLLSGIDREKIKPVMIFNRHGEFVDKIKSLGVETVIIPFHNVMLRSLILPWKFWNLIKDSKMMYRYFKQTKPDVIQCSDVLSLMMISLPALILRVRVIYSIIFFYEWSRMIVFNVLAIFLVDKIIVSSIAVKDDIVRKTIFLSHRIKIFYLGIDLNLFKPIGSNDRNLLREELGLGPTVKLIGMIGRIEPLKGHKYLLQAVPNVLRVRQDVKFIIIGSALFQEVFPFFKKYHDEVLESYKCLNLDKSVIFLPYRDDIPDVMRSLDVLVCPSLYEGFGLVILEALASGIPIVASKTVGALELVHDLPGVFISEPGDHRSIASHILNALSYITEKSLKRNEDLNFNKVQAVLKNHNWHEYALQMEQIYTTL